jgi:hypothetical protein
MAENDVKDVQKTEEPVVAAEVKEAPVAPVVAEKAEPVVEKKAEPKAKPAASKDDEQVGLFAERNLAWSGVGSLVAGLNLVSKKEADKWLGAKLKVRLATPEELKNA